MEELDEWLPSRLEKYYQLVFPILRLCTTILTTKSGNEDFASKALRALLRHEKAFGTFLKLRSGKETNFEYVKAVKK